MDIDVIAKKIREAVMDSAEDQGRTFNASILDDVIAKELRVHWPAAPSAPANYPWVVVPMTFAPHVNEIDLRPGTICWAPVVDDEYR